MRLNPSLSCLLAIASVASPVFGVETLVDLGYAKYQGTRQGDGVSKWLGLRYAAAPLGDLRFAAPQDPVNVSGIVNATQHGPICLPQSPTDWTVSGTYSRFTVSEDCLFASVFAPSDATTDSQLPVVVYIQGGGFGSNSNANWDPSEIVADGDVIVVQFNYRVGAYGFLQSDEVRAAGSLNAGIRDMLKVLEWIQNHIQQFGGNPDQVVVDGASAGGSAVGLLMAASVNVQNEPNFVGGIAESGGWVTMRTMEQGQSQYECLVKDKGCEGAGDSLACLRALNSSAVMTSNCWFNPHIDGELFTDSLVNLFEQGLYAKVPTIWGSCANEGTKYSAPQDTDTVEAANTFLRGQDPTLTNASFAILDDLYISQPETVFPASGRKWRQTANAIGEIGTHCIIKNIQDIIAADGVPTYNYKYAVLDPADEAAGFGAYHTVNSYAFWGNNRTDGDAPKSYFTTNEPIIPVTRKYWTSFIRNTDPNTDRAGGAPEWYPWTGTNSRERLFIQTNNTKMERMSAKQSLRCQVVRPTSENLGKPKDSNATTELDATLASRVNGTSDDTSFNIHARDFVRRRY